MIRDPFMERAWSFYNWLQGGLLHVTISEFDNMEQKLYDGFNVLSSESSRIQEEEKEMRDTGRQDLTSDTGRY